MLHRLPARNRETGAREDLDPGEVSAHRELAERAGEEIVAARTSRPLAVRAPRRRASAAELGPVDEVVVDKGGDVRELDRDAAAQRHLAVRSGQVDEQRSQSLATSSDGVATDGPDHARIALDGRLEPLLELVEIRLRVLENRLRLRRHGRTPVCSATLPPPSNRYLT